MMVQKLLILFYLLWFPAKLFLSMQNRKVSEFPIISFFKHFISCSDFSIRILLEIGLGPMLSLGSTNSRLYHLLLIIVCLTNWWSSLFRAALSTYFFNSFHYTFFYSCIYIYNFSFRDICNYLLLSY